MPIPYAGGFDRVHVQHLAERGDVRRDEIMLMRIVEP